MRRTAYLRIAPLLAIASALACSPESSTEGSQASAVVVSPSRTGMFVIRQAAGGVELLRCRPGVTPEEARPAIESEEATGFALWQLCPDARRLPLADTLAAIKDRFAFARLLTLAKEQAQKPWGPRHALEDRLRDIDAILASLPQDEELASLREEAQTDRAKVAAEIARWETGQPILEAELAALGEPAEKLQVVGERIALALLSKRPRLLPETTSAGASVLHAIFSDLFHLEAQYVVHVQSLGYELEQAGAIFPSPDQKSLVVSRDGALLFVDPASLAITRRLALPELLGQAIAAPLPAGRAVVVGYNAVGVLDLETGATTLVPKTTGDDRPGTGRFAVSAEGSRVVLFRFFDDPSDLRVVQLASGASTRVTLPTCAIHDVAFIGEDRLAVGCEDGTVLTYDLAAGALLRQAKAHEAPVRVAVAGDAIITGGEGWDPAKAEVLKVWDAQRLQEIGSSNVKGHVTSLTVANETRSFVVAGLAGRDAITMSERGELAETVPVQSLQTFAKVGGRTFAHGQDVGSYGTDLLVAEGSSIVLPHRRHADAPLQEGPALIDLLEVPYERWVTVDAKGDAAVWFPTSNYREPQPRHALCEAPARLLRVEQGPTVDREPPLLVATCSTGEGKARTRVIRLPGGAGEPTLVWQQDEDSAPRLSGSRLVYANGVTLFTRDLSSGARSPIADLSAAGFVGFRSAAAGSVDGTFAIVWEPEGDRLARVDLASMTVTTSRTLTPEESGNGHGEPRRARLGWNGSVDGTGTRLSLRTNAGGVRLFDAATLAPASPDERPFEKASAAALSADGEWLAYVRDGKLHVWDVAGDRLLRTYATSAPVSGEPVVAPDKSAVALSSGTTVTLFDPATGLPVQVISTNECAFAAATCSQKVLLPTDALSRFGTMITAGSDGTLRTFVRQ